MKCCFNRVVKVAHATYRDMPTEHSRCVVHNYWWPDGAQVGTWDTCPKAVDNTPHKTGPATCSYCKYTWIAVAPVGTDVLECPKCRITSGFFDT